MARLIDADALRQTMESNLYWGLNTDGTILDTIDEAPTIEAAPVVHGRWIPVEERLPEDGVTVLVCGSRGGIYTAYCNRKHKNPGWHKLNSKCHHCEPTHWMPLPEPPEA